MPEIKNNLSFSEKAWAAIFLITAVLCIISGLAAVKWRTTMAGREFEICMRNHAKALAAAVDPRDARDFAGTDPHLRKIATSRLTQHLAGYQKISSFRSVFVLRSAGGRLVAGPGKFPENQAADRAVVQDLPDLLQKEVQGLSVLTAMPCTGMQLFLQ